MLTTIKEQNSNTKPSKLGASATSQSSTETEAEIHLAEAFSQAMEDGTQTLKSAVIKKEFDRPVYVVAAHPTPSSSATGGDTHMIYETRLDDGDEGILIDTGAAINCVGGELLRPVRRTDGISWGTTNGESQLRFFAHSSLNLRPWERYNKNRYRGMHPMLCPRASPGGKHNSTEPTWRVTRHRPFWECAVCDH